MKHKDVHWSTGQPGLSGSAHRVNHPAGEHPGGRGSEAELRNGPCRPACSDAADINWEILWIDIGGEG
jgi:hypothetical protein